VIRLSGEQIYIAIGNLKASVKELVDALDLLKDEMSSPIAISIIEKTLNETRNELKTLMTTRYQEEQK
jgi:hypothetical protein